ncbi:MAG: 2-oxo-4-hydroxy-4-carboxy-5-ureidoimidazoline decarboxylase [Candidatus Eremiobacteraeota bacterium]|nr:2-oxo-4-hydroxy-4-carboxy-5-ureidoimidazoline decarboxylase [Candidatus Eremiobacteraeota bacterium]
MTIDDLNAADDAAFVAVVGFAFENSPWIAEEAWKLRPFADREALLSSMNAIVAAAPLDRQIALIVAHPDLAGRVAREGRLTPASRDEQGSAGLDTLTLEEIARFDALNAAYRRRFGFPFVICVRENSKASILSSLARRVENPRAGEIATALREIAKIARLRLEDVISE